MAVFLVLSWILKHLHEADSGTVVQVVEVLERSLLLSIALVVVTVLLHGLAGHILTHQCGFLSRHCSPLRLVQSNLGGTVLQLILLVNLIEGGFKTWVAVDSSLTESVDSTLLATLESHKVIRELTVLVFENLVVNNVFKVLMRFLVKCSLNEIEARRVKLSTGGDDLSVEHLLSVWLLWVLLNVGFKVVAVLLFLLGQGTKEICEVLDLTRLLALLHALFAAVVVVGVAELASFELLDFVEETVEFADA